MEDVIFSGSDARKPTATAEVRLRFSGFLKTVSGPRFLTREPRATAITGMATGTGTTATVMETATGTRRRSCRNAPDVAPATGAEEIIQSVAREVEVTRRLYRSGESEYLIDGQVCRLRDVHDLLMDTGLGAKAYAIIEQGKIGMILSIAADRSAAADRGSGRDHQVQGAPPRRPSSSSRPRSRT